MIKKIGIENTAEWDEIIDRFKDVDVYYSSGYVKAFQLHGDGEPILIVWSSSENEGVCVVMKRDVADDSRFNGKIERNLFFDAITPYGYGGFIFQHKPTAEEISLLKHEMRIFCESEVIIDIFFRFHPVLKNAESSRKLLEVIDLGKTISISLESPDIIWNNIISKNRNMIRKAEKNNVEIRHGHGKDLLAKFREIYNRTMDDDNADKYYYFDVPFYESIDDDLKNNYEIFYAVFEEQIISMAIMIFRDQFLNYHLSGSLREYRNLAPSNLLLYKAALWGYENGLKNFHLGGGVGSGEDNLYKFKAAFNRHSDCRFSIGKYIVNQDKYDYLISIRQSDPSFNRQSCFFPLYRS